MTYNGFYWDLLGFNGFYLVLPVQLVALDFSEFFLISMAFTGLYWVLLGFYWI